MWIMGLCLELFKACCASVAKITTFASLDPMFGQPSFTALEYLRQHNISFDEIRTYYREALQKGSYMLELLLTESEGMEENVLTPFLEQTGEDKKSFRSRLITICQKIRSEEAIDDLVNALEDHHIEKAFQEISTSNTLFTAPDAFLFYLNKITGFEATDNAFSFIANKGILFHSIDYQFRFLSFSDNRLKNIAGISSYTKMKLRLSLTSKNIADKQRQKLQATPQEAALLETEIKEYQNALKKMGDYIEEQKNTLEMLNKAMSILEQQTSHEILEKVKEFNLLQGRTKKDAMDASITMEAVEEVQRLTKQAIEILGNDRIDFSHNLMGPVLENHRTKIEKAKTLFEKIPNTHPHKASLANRLGVILNAFGLPDKAAEYFRRALVLLPASSRQERSPIESNLFYALLNKGSFDAALKYMIESLEAGSEECNLFDVERYLPKKILGVGGMGVTFLCEDIYEERLSVVKTLWRYASGGLKEVFSEAFTAKKIENEHIIKIYDIGRHRANRPFIVMEYCSGIDLQKYVYETLKGNPLSVEKSLKIIQEVAKGLKVAHHQSPPIIHRDIKPTNILYHPETEQVKIIDFGIACMLPDPEQISRSITRSSGSVIAKNIAGTWGYMAPEQQRGEAELTAKSDIFSLGKTLMFLLTAKTPPPENIFALSPEIRDRVGELVGYCLMPHSQERYSIDQLLEKIEELQNMKPKQPASATVKKVPPKETAPLPENNELTSFLGLPDDFSLDTEVESAWEEKEEMEAIEANSQEDIEEIKIEKNDISLESKDFQPLEDMSIPQEISISEDHGNSDILKELPEIMEVDSFFPSENQTLSPQGETPQALFDSAAFETQEEVHCEIVEEIEEIPSASSMVISPHDESLESPEIELHESFDLSMDTDQQSQNTQEPNSFDLSQWEENAPMQEEQESEAPLEDTLSSHVSYEIDDFPAPEEPKEEIDGLLKASGPFLQINLPSGYIKEGDLIICEKDGATMVYIPAGSFSMGYEGSNGTFAESPVHEVYMDGYLIDQCPVTWYQYNHFCEETGRKTPASECWEMDDSQPVINVSWEDANAYAEWAGKSLPTEAQWEKAAKGGFYFDGEDSKKQRNHLPDRRYTWGNILPNQGEEWLANCVGEPMYGQRSPSPVGLYLQGASPYGCLDMCGNVWEFCQDWFLDTYYKSCPNKNPKGPKNGAGKVLRGGAWNSEVDKISTTYRSWMEPNDWWNIIGFRTVKNLSQI